MGPLLSIVSVFFNPVLLKATIDPSKADLFVSEDPTGIAAGGGGGGGGGAFKLNGMSGGGGGGAGGGGDTIVRFVSSIRPESNKT